jgi:hypothetical protein
MVQCQRAAPTETIDDDWTGAIYLPQRRGSSLRMFFHARLTGPIDLTPFAATSADWNLQPSPHQPAIQWLIDSRFTPIEWRVRPNATHARSKTVKLR